MPGDIVLLTRPQRDSERVAAELVGDGIETAIWPLTRIVWTDQTVAVPDDTDAVVFTSRNAVEAFAARTSRRDLPAWCVGERTARAAQQAGIVDVTSAAGDVTDLVASLRERPPMRLFYPRARHVSTELAALLHGSGHVLNDAIVYSAEPGLDPPENVSTGLASGAIGIVTIWSRRAAAILARHLANHPDWPAASLRCIAIAARASEPLRASGVDIVHDAVRPDGAAMLDAIRAAVRQKTGER